MSSEPVAVAIVTPAFEEWDNLLELAPKVLEVLQTMRHGSEWIIVCEPTPPVAKRTQLESASEMIRVIEREPVSISFARALELGLSSVNSKASYVVTMDADQSHNPATIQQLIQRISDDSVTPDVVIASRYVQGGESENSWSLKAMSLILNRVFRWSLKIDARDLSTNFKVFHAEDVRGEKLFSRNFEAVEELLLLVKYKRKADLRVVEIPDRFSLRKHGHSKRKLGQFIGSYLVSLILLNRSIEQREAKRK